MDNVQYLNIKVNILTIDVEDWFHILNANIPDINKWDELPSIVTEGVLKILDILDEYENKATFFVLGWIAKKYPFLIKEIYERGHEIASQSYNHKKLYLMSRKEIVKDIKIGKEILENIIGEKVVGYRAPGFSAKGYIELLNVLIDLRFIYDANAFPVKREAGVNTTFEQYPLIY